MTQLKLSGTWTALVNLFFLLCTSVHCFTDEDPAFSIPEKRQSSVGSGAPYWYGNIQHRGAVAYGDNASYIVWRNVKDYGAQGDGVTDDFYAILNATNDGNRCGYGCQSQTTAPAVVYFPPGIYMSSGPLEMDYYTQFIGDANDLPTIKALTNFTGIALVDSDPYDGPNPRFVNQNNFWRQVRNLILDITDLSADPFSCLHWQVAQGTSVQNVVFNMATGLVNNTQMGIFMENGSGGWVEDLIFNGGGISFFTGNQQWTSRNLTFNNCGTAIYQNWNWVYTYKSIFVNDCNIGIDMSQGGEVITTGSVVIQDSAFTNVLTAGIWTTFSSNSTPVSGGTLILDNVQFVDTPVAVEYPNGTLILAGDQTVSSWMQGRVYSAFDSDQEVDGQECYEPAANSARVQQTVVTPPKPASLLTPTGTYYERSKPQYEGIAVESVISIKAYGCTGDGVTDDTQCVQNFLDSIQDGELAFFDHGAYVISDTILVPNVINMTGEIWPLIMVDGSSPTFSDQNNPQPAFRVGLPGETGAVEMSDLIFETLGPAPGAIMTEWNLGQTFQGSNGLWDVHWRIGGSNGTQLQSTNCTKNPAVYAGANTTCYGAFLLLHITSTGQLLMANNWGWVADHEMDLLDGNQIDIYNGRGLLVESQGPVWLYGAAFEHSMLVNFHIANAKDIYLGIIQSETAYMQDNPNSIQPYPPKTAYSDPTFSDCYEQTCFKTYGLRVYNSTYIFMYGAGLYSFFNNYDQGCLITSNCQQNMVAVDQSEAIYLYALSTKATENMVTVDDVEIVPRTANVNGFCDSVAIFEYP